MRSTIAIAIAGLSLHSFCEFYSTIFIFICPFISCNHQKWYVLHTANVPHGVIVYTVSEPNKFKKKLPPFLQMQRIEV